MRKMLGIFTIAVAAFFLIAVSASATPKSHHHPKGVYHGGNGNWGGSQGGQCGEQGDHQSNGEGDNGGQCQCNQGDHAGQGDQGGDQGDCHRGDGGGGGDPTPPPPPVQPPSDSSSTFLCYSLFEVDPAVYTFGSAWHWLTSTSDHYFTPDAVAGNVPYGTNVGGYHLVCNAGLLGDTAGTPKTYTDSDGDVFGQAWADAMASDYGSYNGMTLNVFPIVG